MMALFVLPITSGHPVTLACITLIFYSYSSYTTIEFIYQFRKHCPENATLKTEFQQKSEAKIISMNGDLQLWSSVSHTHPWQEGGSSVSGCCPWASGGKT